MNKSTKTPQNNKIKPFVDKYNWEVIGIKLRKMN